LDLEGVWKLKVIDTPLNGQCPNLELELQETPESSWEDALKMLPVLRDGFARIYDLTFDRDYMSGFASGKSGSGERIRSNSYTASMASHIAERHSNIPNDILSPLELEKTTTEPGMPKVSSADDLAALDVAYVLSQWAPLTGYKVQPRWISSPTTILSGYPGGDSVCPSVLTCLHEENKVIG
jgi:hypothetical protein